MNGKFTVLVTSLITDLNLDSFEYRILSYLISCSKDGQCFPSVETISEKTGIGISTVKSRLKKLVAKKYITQSNRTIGSGKKTSNIYTINQKYLVVREARYEDTKVANEELFDYDWLNGNEENNY